MKALVNIYRTFITGACTDHHWPGLEFVNQLTVDDNERAATLVTVSSK